MQPLGPLAYILTTPLSHTGGLSTDDGAGELDDLDRFSSRLEGTGEGGTDWLGDGGDEESSPSLDSGDNGAHGLLNSSSSLGKEGWPVRRFNKCC